MTTVSQVIQQKKNSTIFTISPDASIVDAVNLMTTQDIGAVIVTEHQRVVGILSERDCARKVILHSLNAEDTLVSEIMTANVISVRLNNSVEECLTLMTDRHLRHLPVLENEVLVGLVAIGDLVKATIQDQHDLIEQLQRYITS
ncbi:CBS domain-containing protein [Acinetobacter sp. MD2(2019)]|uniref:CBS domain-containing protein n=1 Tax=Acinetobacter sp. MD2(2019) TaxID=2605273 RepID=UPI002D1EF45A|nr:CBS domain-containing protein [Acinetobacter sp. MD2(2019)]MEB3752942.1 CBS domain-containing protein [Acinetobacter sp. MD2(2019)]